MCSYKAYMGKLKRPMFAILNGAQNPEIKVFRCLTSLLACKLGN